MRKRIKPLTHSLKPHRFYSKTIQGVQSETGDATTEEDITTATSCNMTKTTTLKGENRASGTRARTEADSSGGGGRFLRAAPMTEGLAGL